MAGELTGRKITVTHTLPTVVRLVGAMFLVFGSMAVLISPFASIIPLAGAFALFYTKGLITDFDKKMIKPYQGWLFIRIGDWIPIDSMEYLFMTKRKLRYKLYSLPNVNMKVEESSYYIGFTNEKKKPLIDFQKFKTHPEAEAAGHSLANQLGLRIIKSKNFK